MKKENLLPNLSPPILRSIPGAGGGGGEISTATAVVNVGVSASSGFDLNVLLGGKSQQEIQMDIARDKWKEAEARGDLSEAGRWKESWTELAVNGPVETVAPDAPVHEQIGGVLRNFIRFGGGW